MRRYDLKTDASFYEAMQDYNQRIEEDLFGSNEWHLDTPSCNGMVSNLRLLEGVAITLFDIVTYKPVAFTSNIASPRLIELGFVTSGVIEMNIQGCRREFDALAGQNYLTMIEGDLSVKTVAPAGQRVQLVEIRFTPEALDQYCHKVGQIVPKHLAQCYTKTNVAPYKYSSVLTSEMRGLVRDIFSNSPKHRASSLFLESKCLDLAANYFTFANDRIPTTSTTLSPRDIERVREARHILSKRMADPPSLMELARLVNLNDFKLKLGFKQAYGTTAYGYLKEIRLQQGLTLLRDHKKSVTETAFTVGYQNIGDFGIAFKRRFGISPKYAQLVKNP